ncbi:trehalose-phosphatase [Corynebacterium breve]|uniref:Trehalose 6-phosphate phosphatase n=1 Tax=Corynebacterium breve TaxID=3049799 RepID=A0ABY8VJB2_9CORY|nr:trehalose-phosphatase [Corynebacterium breve]WIM69066.1 trehalose-phosphatase [Corynebacterium breve]
MIASLAQSERLLVVTDFDGTLAELNPDPYAVQAHPGAVAALERLAGMRDTEVVVLSGRHLAGLRRVCPLEAPVVLVGSHGAEPSDGAVVLSDDDAAFLTHIEAELDAIVSGHSPAYVEIKPYQRVIHVAQLAQKDPELAAELLDRAAALDTQGHPVTPGSNIIEFSAVDVTKGSWVKLRKVGFDATVFAGDDVTDESVYPVLGTHDVGIKVGSANTVAGHRVPDVGAMATFYQELAQARAEFLGAATV